MNAVTVAALVLVAANVALIVALIGRQAWLTRSRRRVEEARRRLRPAAITLIDGDQPGALPVLTGFDQVVFADLLVRYSGQLRGESRQRIVDYFERTGAVDHQLRRLRRRRSWRRAEAAFALGQMGAPRVTDLLVTALDDPSRDVRIAAARSLGRLSSADAIPALVIAGVDNRIPNNVAMLALLDIGPVAVPQLLTLTADAQPAVRAAAVEVVGLLGTATDAPPLLQHLVDPAAAVRAMSAGALGRLGAGAAQDALVRALDDRVPAVRTAAATALGHLGGPPAVDALMAVARTDDFEPARAAADAVARIDPHLLGSMAGEPDAGAHLVEAADRVRL